MCPDVSGVGVYTTAVELADVSGRIEFATAHVPGMTYAVYVNGAKAPAVDFDNPTVDITALVKPGCNELRVEVGTTLTNRLLKRGYFDQIPVKMGMIMSDPTIFGEGPGSGETPEGAPEGGEGGGFPPMNLACPPQDYGMLGFAKIIVTK